MPEESAYPELKHWFDAALYRRLAKELSAIAPAFDRKRFLHLTLTGLDERALMARMRQTAFAIAEALPGAYREQLAALRELAPRIKHRFVAIFLPEFVALRGLDDFESSMDALRFFTRFGSAEFAIRPFLLRDPARTLAVMERWARDSGEDVRRLASEGCRPRLPWGQRLPALVRDPAPLAPILELLKDDPSLYVRKSVANNLNDIAKDHPDWVLARLESWDLSSPRTAWIAQRAARTLIKQGNVRALRLLGVDHGVEIRAQLSVRPARVKVGQAITLESSLVSDAPMPVKVVVDYVMHFARTNGSAAKVFKWAKLDLAPGATAALTKRQTLRDFTTRRLVAGRHRVELQVNGRRLAAAEFWLRR